MGNCPAAPGAGKIDTKPIVGSITFQSLIIYINYACFGLTFLMWLGLAIPHLRRYKAPDEQRPIFRIISTPIVFCLISLIAVHAYGAAEYLDPIASLYEAYALASLFLLYVHYVVPEARNRHEFFRNLEDTARDGTPIREGSLRWFLRVWRSVFFFVVIYTILIIIQEILQATGHVCATTKKGKLGRVILSVLEAVAMVYALLTILRFQRRLKRYMEGRRAVLKLITFKLFVAVQVVQRFVFSIVTTQVHGTSKVTFQDIAVGLPALLTSIECFLFSIGFYFTFHSQEYQEWTAAPTRKYGGLRALLHALNPSDLIHGVIIAFTTWNVKTPEFVVPDSDSTIHHARPEPIDGPVSTIHHVKPKPV